MKRLIETPQGLSRRELLLKTVFGAGFVGLRALATGLPISFLLNPRRALASGLPPACSTNPNAQYLILATSGNGDPVNTNIPGTYAADGSNSNGLLHPTDPTMAATKLTLGSTSTWAAAPWAALPSAMLAQTCFFHHGTYTLIHPDEPNVMSLMDLTTNDEMLVSMFAKQLAPCLNTVQQQPVALGQESVTFGGQPLPNLPPTSLAKMLATPTGPLAQLTTMRDADLDSIHALLKQEGNSAQKAFIDNYATSRDQVRTLSQSLIGALSAIPDNTPASQLQAALILIQMNVSPVMVVHLDFGGDNHSDANLATETVQTVTTLQSLATFWQQLQAPGLAGRISMAMLNVFGRTLATNGSATISAANGRTHNPNHHAMVMIGQPFTGSVIGGVEPVSASNQAGIIPGPDYSAMSIDPTTGVGVPAGVGALKYNDTLQAAAVTLGVGLGVSQSYLTQNISGGSVVNAALSSNP